MIETQSALVEAGLLPAEMPQNFTYRKVREVLAEIRVEDRAVLSAALAAAKRLEVRAPLAVVIFIKHHLQGAHDVEVDRVDESEEQSKSYAVLVYPEGEVAVGTEFLPDKAQAGTRVHYDPVIGEYSAVSS
jgi:hypothetical protein